MTKTNTISINRIQLVNCILLLSLVLGAALLYTPFIAESVFFGGLLAGLSFWWLKRDIKNVLSGSLQAAKLLFFVKYYARLSLLAVVLFYLIKNQKVHVIGLLVGLSTIVLSIVITGAGEAKKLFTSLKEA